MTVDRRRRDPADDVATARAGVDHARSTYGPQRRERYTAVDRLRDFVRRYGWRAYALPALVVITVGALLTTATGSSRGTHHDAAKPNGAPPHSAPPTAGGNVDLKDDAPNGKIDDTALKAAALPAGPAYSTTGNGTYRVLSGTSPVVGKGRLFRYSIDVENGVDDVDLAQFQKMVVTVLGDPRSWSGHGVSLQRVDHGQIDFHVTMTSSMTVRKLCGYDIHVETSCYVQAGSAGGLDANRVVINDARWVRGSTAYVGDLNAYRIYMINHEDGHAMGHEHAHQCLPGGLAPVMMQQTFGLRSAVTSKYCEANPWPYPPGAKGTPGKEQPDTPANDEYGLGD